MALTFTLIYLIGFFLTLTFFKYFGKKIGFDYDSPHEDYYDDWNNSAEAYLSFSFFWFMMMPILLLIGIINLMVRFTKWYIKNPNN